MSRLRLTVAGDCLSCYFRLKGSWRVWYCIMAGLLLYSTLILCDCFNNCVSGQLLTNNNVSQVSACCRVELILGVLGWSTGCSWPSLMEDHEVL